MECKEKNEHKSMISYILALQQQRMEKSTVEFPHEQDY